MEANMDGYPSRVARAVTGVSPMQLAYWSRTSLVVPSTAPGRGRGTTRLYSFRDLVQLAVVRKLLGAGVSLQRVRKAVAYLRKHFPEVEHPLAELTLLTDGDSVFHLTNDAEVIVDTVRHGGQLVYALAVGKLVEAVRGKLATIPMAQTSTITVDDFEFPVRLTPDPDDGGYVAECPGLPGCLSQGDTVAEALANIMDAARGWLAANADQEKAGKVFPLPLQRFRRRGKAGDMKHKVRRVATR
jgi:predicted RNase H-like HicB family nuclease/DNA-binding transcriptional MerR regulator